MIKQKLAAIVTAAFLALVANSAKADMFALFLQGYNEQTQASYFQFSSPSKIPGDAAVFSEESECDRFKAYRVKFLTEQLGLKVKGTCLSVQGLAVPVEKLTEESDLTDSI